MRIDPLGDTACILRELPANPAAVARALELGEIPGVVDVVPSATTVGVYFDQPVPFALLEEAVDDVEDLTVPSFTHQIPVCYEFGDDLAAVAATLDLSVESFINLHTSCEFECFAIGFCPGFAYLGPLPEGLRGIARMTTPRVRTAPGSVGITGNQTAVYPLPRPGGWPIVGMTPLTLVNEVDDYFPISVGDRIRFSQISKEEFQSRQGERL